MTDETARRGLNAKVWLRAEIREGLAELDRGEWVDGDEAYRQVTETIERARRRSLERRPGG
jgi:predicted transcriptional regulator